MPKIPNWSRRQDLESDGTENYIDRAWENDTTGDLLQVHVIDKYTRDVRLNETTKRRYTNAGGNASHEVRGNLQNARDYAKDWARDHPQKDEGTGDERGYPYGEERTLKCSTCGRMIDETEDENLDLIEHQEVFPGDDCHGHFRPV